MSSTRREQFIADFTSFLSNVVEATYFALANRTTPDYPRALGCLYWLIPFLDQKGQKSLEEDSKEIEHMLEHGISKEEEKLIRKLLSKTMLLLHKEGYFLSARMAIPRYGEGVLTLEPR